MDDLKSKSMIELAMDKAAQDAAQSQPDSLVRRQRKSDWHPAQDPESGQGEPADPAPPLPAAGTGAAQHLSGKSDQPAPRFGLPAMLAAVMLSVWTGAGAMWLLTRGAPSGGHAAASVGSSVPAPQHTAVANKADADDGASQARYLLERWRQAWAARDVAAYLNCYSPAFAPANGQSRAAWESARRKRLATRDAIRVHVRELNLERIADDRIRLTFMQDYASGAYRENARQKILTLIRGRDGWKIETEWQQGQPPAK